MLHHRRNQWIFVIAALLVLGAASLSSSFAAPAIAQEAIDVPTADNSEYEWYRLDENGEPIVTLWFFWSKSCPHCQHAHPFIMDLPNQLPWLELKDLELNTAPENTQLYVDMAASVDEQAMYVPAFIYCGHMEAGYDDHDTTGAALKEDLIACYERTKVELAQTSTSSGDITGDTAAAGAESESVGAEAAVQGELEPADLMVAGAAVERQSTINIPLMGSVNASALSLPALTLLIAAVDSVNPCAIFVLMFLLSLMVHAQSRTRMLIIGMVFVFFSGLIYFVFMAAWLNVFMWIGEIQLITTIAGLVAMGIAIINIKDFFFYKQGVSLSIPDSAKPGLYARTRHLVQAGSLGAMVFSTALLAIAANSYELLCTAGFPMVYTRILTMSDLSTAAYYAYLVAYNVIYVIPLFAIVVAFSFFLGSRKLGEAEGRALKLVSGMMMLMLGFVLVFAPQSLNNMTVSVSIVFTALALSAIIIFVDHRWFQKKPAPGKVRPRKATR